MSLPDLFGMEVIESDALPPDTVLLRSGRQFVLCNIATGEVREWTAPDPLELLRGGTLFPQSGALR